MDTMEKIILDLSGYKDKKGKDSLEQKKKIEDQAVIHYLMTEFPETQKIDPDKYQNLTDEGKIELAYQIAIQFGPERLSELPQFQYFNVLVCLLEIRRKKDIIPKIFELYGKRIDLDEVKKTLDRALSEGTPLLDYENSKGERFDWDRLREVIKEVEAQALSTLAEIPTDVTIKSRVGEINKLMSLDERLARLRESNEVIEEDSDMNDIFMFVRSDIPLTKSCFLSSFPKAKALVITQEQLWQIEADGNYLSYITASGKRKYVNADDMKEPLVLFLEDLG